jgi:signal transduction histidine kinase
LIASAHELKSPLSLIRQLALSLSQDDLDSGEIETMRRQIVLISERALRLTSDLTRSSRLDNTLFELEPLSSYQVCRRVVDDLRPMFVAQGREIIMTSSFRRSNLVVANHDLLYRVLMNFGDNSLHYAGDSRIKITAKSVARGAMVRFGVRDYGPYIPPKVLKTLRERLAVAHAPVATRPQSSGLGLYISSQFAEAMNGRIGFIRHRNGATFFVDLPASKQLSLL